MVSLEENTKGGFTFESTVGNEDLIETVSNSNLISDTLPLTSPAEPNFRKIDTIPAILFQIFSVVLFEAGVFLLPYFCTSKNVDFNSFDLLIYIHAGFWLLKLLFDRYYHFRHMASKRCGYLEFYRKTRLIRSLPLIIVSAGNSILVVLVKVLTTHCPKQCTFLKFTPVNFLQAYVTLETIILLPILLFYLKQTYTFNNESKTPDINKEIDRPNFMPFQLNDIGYKDSSYIKNVLENQADMIRYLQERNKNLVRKLYNLKDVPSVTQYEQYHSIN